MKTEIDLTASSDEEVLKVFKAMGDDDEVEVIKDEDGIHLTDNETGAEYYIKESEQLEEDDLCEDAVMMLFMKSNLMNIKDMMTKKTNLSE